jgi:hypothetical protein
LTKPENMMTKKGLIVVVYVSNREPTLRAEKTWISLV